MSNNQNNKVKIIIGLLSFIVLSLVAFMYLFPSFQTMFDTNFPNFDKKILPLGNAIINFCVSVSLILALYFILKKQIGLHRLFIVIACILSTMFLLNYVLYHMISTSTPYGGSGIMRIIYLLILLTHIVLAAVSFPFILYTVYLGWTYQTNLHKKFTRFVFPIWLYVAISGVIVYCMISPYY